MTYDTMCRRAN